MPTLPAAAAALARRHPRASCLCNALSTHPWCVERHVVATAVDAKSVPRRRRSRERRGTLGHAAKSSRVSAVLMPNAACAPSAAATIESWTSSMTLPAAKTPGTLVTAYLPHSIRPFRFKSHPTNSAEARLPARGQIKEQRGPRKHASVLENDFFQAAFASVQPVYPSGRESDMVSRKLGLLVLHYCSRPNFSRLSRRALYKPGNCRSIEAGLPAWRQ